MNKIKIVIVGGGTAGWMAAGYFSKYYDPTDITVIESPRISKIGVGESVTPHVNDFFEEIGIDRHDWMQKTGSVYKLANKFTNWKYNKGEFEYFSFTYPTSSDKFFKDVTQVITKEDFTNTEMKTTDYFLSLIQEENLKFDKYFNPQYHYMEKNVSPFFYKDCLLNTPYSYSQHINAELAGSYIRDYIAIPRGVNHIVSDVKDVKTKKNNIEHIVLDNGNQINGDLFLDCTGFHKVLINNMHWPEKLYKDNKIDSAWVCQTDYSNQENEMKNYTESIAEPYGWRFKIGLYHRMGNGYCFSREHIDPDAALDYFTSKINVGNASPRLIQWQPKRLTKFGEGNLAAVGLSCGFIEPLEANQLYTIVTSIRRLNSVIRNFLDTDNLDFAQYNEKMGHTIDDIADFILVHYTLSSRTDTVFWQDMQLLGDRLNHKSLLYKKYKDKKNSMQGAITGFTLFPDYMWAQLAVSWEYMQDFKNTLDNPTFNLAKQHYKYSENKHNLISESLTNNYLWHKENIFDNMDPEQWKLTHRIQ